MPTTGPILGRHWGLLWNTVSIDRLKSVSLTTNMGTIDITSYDSNSYREILDGIKDWSISASFIVAYDATEGYDELLTDWTNSASGTALLSTGVTGDSTFSGTGYITSIDKSGDLEGVVEGSITIIGTGAPTIGTVSA